MKKFTFIFLFLLSFSCKENTRPPQDLIPKKMMENVLLDVNLAESYSAMVKDTVHKAGTKNPDSLTLYYKDIFSHYKITERQFSSSLNWYKSHPDQLDSMYNNIIPVVTKWQTIPKTAVPLPSNMKTGK